MNMMGRGHLYVVSGPSGTGKGAICGGVVKITKTALSVSMTTRAPRPREQDGKSYHFVTKERFCEVVSENGFFEYVEVYGEYYGTPKAPVLENLEKGKDVILEIEVDGAKQVHDCVPEAILIFILPPSYDELKKRIEKRGTETSECIDDRLARAESEIGRIGDYYDYIVVNDDLTRAIADVISIIRVEELMAQMPSSQFHSQADIAVLRRAEQLRVAPNAEKIIERYKTGKMK